MRLGILVLGGMLLLGISPGCVSLSEYGAKTDRIEQQDRLIHDQDAEILGLMNMVNIMEAKLRQEKAENALLSEKSAWYSEAINRASAEPDPDYLDRLRELQRATPDIVINEDTGGIVLDSDIFFGSGKAGLSSRGKRTLKQIIDVLQGSAYAPYQIEIAGHTDTDPIRKSKFKDNWQLSADRARSVLLEMVTRGVAAERLHTAGYSYTRPRRPNTSKDNKRMNRRVEIVLSRARFEYSEGR
ncbi:MAG: OmpA family protein [Planctomycetota bacterium]|nr:OmpA family protein [Planctomycetota bacterium]